MSLVLMLAVASSFGLKAQSMRWVLYSGFGLLALAVVSGFVAFGAAAFVRKARREAYQLRLSTLCQVLEHTLNVLRSLNNNYFLPNGQLVSEPIVGRYYHCYSVVMLATMVPLFHHLIERASHSAACKHVAGLEHLLRGVNISSDTATQGLPPVDGVLRYWSMWCAGTWRLDKGRRFSHCYDDVDWNVGVLGLEYEPYYGGSDHLRITSGTLPDGSPACERINSIDKQAKKLVAELLAGVAELPSLGKYRAAVKHMFMAANLSHMMPPSIRTARADAAGLYYGSLLQQRL
ncbi:hypothetical protein OEZ85_013392 [Tetradesmus obliquus]|uniref:Uncharacterized protein n=1 Tax=Tetradesmus obliquus TaxID=3088 RepID=A0ABY8U5K2_TETOB|nr:hypothetical protein OEZ85_013392 [Tetradesmus obliquus]